MIGIMKVNTVSTTEQCDVLTPKTPHMRDYDRDCHALTSSVRSTNRGIPMKTVANRFVLLLIALAALFPVGCGEDDPVAPDDNLGEEFTTFDVDWKEDVVYFDSTDIAALTRIDTAEERYHFHADNPKAASLAAGNILLIHGTALRKVVSTAVVGEEIVVETGEAYLTDAIENGKVAWNKAFEFEEAETPALIIDGSEVAIEKAVRTQGGFSYTAEFGSYAYEIAMDFSGEDATVTCTITETAGLGVSSEFKLEGTMKKLRSTSRIEFAGGDISNVQYSNRNLRGELTASMTVKQQTADYGFKVPVVLLKYPFLVGPIPVVLNVRLEWALTAGIPIGGEASVASTFSFDSETGFSYDGTELTANGQVGPWSASTEKAESGAVGAMYAEFAIGFPQVEVDVFFKTFVPYARTTFLIRGDYSVSGLGGQSCQTAKAVFAGVVGAKLSALGLIELGERQFQLWAVEKELLREGDC